jgi:hypothetical protein
MIPKIIHQVWVGPYEIPDREKHFMSLIKEMHPDFEHRLWTDSNLPELHEEIVSKMNVFRERKDYVFIADMLRVIVVKLFGGVYMDVDYKCLKSMHDWNLENHDGLLIYHEEYTAGNEFFGSKANTGYINYLYEDIIKTKNLDFLPFWFNTKMKEYFKVEDVNDYASEKCRIVGQQLFDAWDKENIKYVRRHGDFHAHFEHYGLNSWDSYHKKYFEEGRVNYSDEIYKKPW